MMQIYHGVPFCKTEKGTYTSGIKFKIKSPSPSRGSLAKLRDTFCNEKYNLCQEERPDNFSLFPSPSLPGRKNV